MSTITYRLTTMLLKILKVMKILQITLEEISRVQQVHHRNFCHFVNIVIDVNFLHHKFMINLTLATTAPDEHYSS